MSNAYMNQFYLSPEKSKCVLFAKVAIGATGAPTLNAAQSKGIASIVRNSAGNYTITLKDVWNKLYMVQSATVFAGGLPANASMGIASESVASAKTIVIQCRAPAGTAVDPDNGALLLLEIQLGNSSV